MYAIVKDEDGTNYTSPVFAYYNSITATDKFQRYLESIYNRFYVVLNREGTGLIKQYAFRKSDPTLNLRIHIVNAEQDDWIVDADGYGCTAFLQSVDFLADELIVPPQLLKVCCQRGQEEHYQEFVDIETDRDIQNFEVVSGGLHDAFIETLRATEDSLYILFDGCWGLKFEMWFSGDVAYHLSENGDSEWLDSTLKKENGYLYLIDEGDINIADISDDYCWFKAKNIRYRVLVK